MTGRAVDDRVVGVLGTDVAEAVAAAESAGLGVATGDAGSVLSAGPDVVVAVGQAALLSLVATDPAPDAPLLPVAAGPGVPSVPDGETAAALERFLGEDADREAEGAERVTCPVLGATVAGTERARALADLFLVTAEPARISEYAVYSDGREVDTFRADGVVVATPLGSHGYARSVGAPVLARSTGVVAVTPVAPFATDPDHWVLPADAVSLTVERDAATVELLADDRTADTVPPRTPVEIAPVDDVTIVVVPESRDPWRTPPA